MCNGERERERERAKKEMMIHVVWKHVGVTKKSNSIDLMQMMIDDQQIKSLGGAIKNSSLSYLTLPLLSR